MTREPPRPERPSDGLRRRPGPFAQRSGGSHFANQTLPQRMSNPGGHSHRHDIESKSAARRRCRNPPRLRPAPGGSDPGIPGPAGRVRWWPDGGRARGSGMAAQPMPAPGTTAPPSPRPPCPRPVPITEAAASLSRGSQGSVRSRRPPQGPHPDPWSWARGGVRSLLGDGLAAVPIKS